MNIRGRKYPAHSTRALRHVPQNGFSKSHYITKPLDLRVLCEDGGRYTLFFRFKHVTHAFDRPGTPTMVSKVQSLAKQMHFFKATAGRSIAG